MNGVKPENIDLNRYLGKWYEIDSFPAWFQRDCLESSATAYYSKNKSGSIDVKNTCKSKKRGTMNIKKGKAVPTEKSNVFKVQFFPLIKADYIIEFLAEAPQGQKYPYVIVGSTGKNYMWILSREKHPIETRVKELIEIARRKGYDITKLQKYGD